MVEGVKEVVVVSSMSTINIRTSFEQWVLENTLQLTDDMNESKVEEIALLQCIYLWF